jgi:hypothetical protein
MLVIRQSKRVIVITEQALITMCVFFWFCFNAIIRHVSFTFMHSIQVAGKILLSDFFSMLFLYLTIQTFFAQWIDLSRYQGLLMVPVLSAYIVHKKMIYHNSNDEGTVTTSCVYEDKSRQSD